MPPEPTIYQGRESLAPLYDLAFDPAFVASWRLVATRANRQLAAANYLRRPGETTWRPFKIDVLRVEAGVIAEITTFDADLLPTFGLPPRLT